MRRRLRVLSATILLSVPALAGSGTVADDDQDVAALNITSAKTFTVSNKGKDRNIVAVAKDASGNIVGWIDVGHGSSKDIGVPAGGSLVIDDRDYAGSQTNPTITDDAGAEGAAYSFT